MTSTTIVEVWTPLAAFFAIGTGILFGLAVGWISINPAYSVGIAGALRIGLLATLFAMSAGLLFFAGQALATLVGGDPLWVRVMSRYGLWVLFSASIGLTTFVQVRRDKAARRRRAHDLVVSARSDGES